MNGVLSWRRRPGGSAWNRKNGFFLVGDSLAAFVLGTLLIVTALVVAHQALAIHQRAKRVQQVAMLARSLMEKTGPDAAQTEEQELAGHTYQVERECLPYERDYERQTIHIYEKGEKLYSLTRIVVKEGEDDVVATDSDHPSAREGHPDRQDQAEPTGPDLQPSGR